MSHEMIFTPMAVAESAHIALGYRITIGQNRGDTLHESPGPTTAGASLFDPPSLALTRAAFV